MRTLTIDFHNWYNVDTNILIYQKMRDANGLMLNVVWRKMVIPHNSLTPIKWDENYCFCIGKKEGRDHVSTISTTNARPGDEARVSTDYRSGEFFFGNVIQGGRSNDYLITADSSIPMQSNDYCIGLGIDNKLFCATEWLQPNMNYVFATQPDYYILRSDKFNEGDRLTDEIEQAAHKLAFPANGKLEILLHDPDYWIIRPA